MKKNARRYEAKKRHRQENSDLFLKVRGYRVSYHAADRIKERIGNGQSLVDIICMVGNIIDSPDYVEPCEKGRTIYHNGKFGIVLDEKEMAIVTFIDYS